MKNTTGLKTRVLCVSIVLIVGIIAFESYLRLTNFSFNPPFFKEDIPFINRKSVKAEGIYKFDFFLFWKYKPNGNYQINSLGFRNREFLPKKEKQFRIIAFGDSCTAGHQVPPEKTYSNYLEKLLNENIPDKKYEVINAGVPGYTSFQGLRYFKILAEEYHPDFIIVYYGTNDRKKARYQDKELSFFHLIKVSSVRFFAGYSKVIQFIMKKNYKLYPLDWRVRVSPEDYKMNIDRFKQEALKKDIKILFIKSCSRQEIESLEKDRTYVPAEPYIDLYDLFYGKPSEKIFFDSQHFTESGHELLAREIYNKFTDERN